jgi:mgtE-like transporter
LPVYRTKRIVRESIVPLLVLVPLATLAGQVLNVGRDLLLAYPTIALLIPAFVNSIGDLVTVLASRLTTGLALGTITSSLTKSRKIISLNVRLILAAGMVFFLLLSTIVYLIGLGLGWASPSLPRIIIATLFASLASILLLSTLAIPLTLSIHRRGWDPDNAIPPFASTFGDLSGNLFLIVFFIYMVGGGA